MPQRLTARVASIIIVLVILNTPAFTQIETLAQDILLKNPVIATGHIGLSIYSLEDQKMLYDYNGNKYFIPASNCKLFTCYAGMKYLGDSIKGLGYIYQDSVLTVYPSGDPSFLHPLFEPQPVYHFLQHYPHIRINTACWQEEPYGVGWAWDDYNDEYMAERSCWPMFGNLAHFELEETRIGNTNTINRKFTVTPDCFSKKIFRKSVFYKQPARVIKGKWVPDFFEIKRDRLTNNFYSYYADKAFTNTFIPFSLNQKNLLNDLMHDTLHIHDLSFNEEEQKPDRHQMKYVFSRPADSLFREMMYNSDNFVAEQTLLMVSEEKLGMMKDKEIIDTLLANDLTDIPQVPKWVDGSGLSRYNLFTPQSFVYILNKMYQEMGLERIKGILPGGGAGTLKNYYLNDHDWIYAKTGSLSNNTSLSGFIRTNRGKWLTFSILVNNFTGGLTDVKRCMEEFLTKVKENF